MKLTKTIILKRTIKWMNRDSFKTCLDQTGKNCLYADGKGNNCAVGRFLKPEFKRSTELPFEGQGSSTAIGKPEYFTQNFNKFVAKGVSSRIFLSALQTLHDQSNEETTDQLNRRVSDICEDHNIDPNEVGIIL